MDNEIRLRIGHIAVVPHLRNPVVIDGMGESVCFADIDVGGSDSVRKFAADHLEHVIAG